jgi:hypothetical protein
MTDKGTYYPQVKESSARECGCDSGAGWVCELHRIPPYEPGQLVKVPGSKKWNKLPGIADSGERVTYASGSMRDPSTGKIDWTRITYGPMMRRWAQHLTTAEAKYPDHAPGVPNFSLISTDEEFYRYKKSAFRHFMSWFNDEVDEDHASAVFFNINGVEIIKEKNAAKSRDI